MLHRCAGVQIANQAWGWEARIGRTAEHSWCLQQLDTRTYIGKREDIRSLGLSCPRTTCVSATIKESLEASSLADDSS